MDDQVQNPTIQSSQNVNNDEASSPSQPQQQPTQTPVSFSPTKESEPVIVSNQEINLPPEVEAAGVEIVKDSPTLDEVHRQLGVTLPGPSTPVVTEPTDKVQVKLPMTQQEAVVAEKGKDNDSRTWLGTLFAKIYRKLGVLGLREVKG